VANIRSDTTFTQTNVFTDLFIKTKYTNVFIFVIFFLIEIREKLHSQRESVISLPNRETHSKTVKLDRYGAIF